MKTVMTPPGGAEGLKVPVPERALLELLSEVGTHQGLEEARAEPVTLKTLLAARFSLRAELPNRLTDRHRAFLVDLTRAELDWTLLKCLCAAELPALR